MSDVINVLVTIPDMNDDRTEEERAETLARFHALDQRIRFTFVEYLDGTHMRQLLKRDHLPPAELAPELRAALAEADVALTVDLPQDVHLLAPKLRWVQCFGAGVRQLQTCGLDKLDATLTNSAGATADSIAEFALARILSNWKIFSIYRQAQAEHRWEQANGRSLAGSTIGVIGFGAIAQAIAWRAKAWRMRVLVGRQRPNVASDDPAVDAFYGPERLKEMLALCDAVVLCAAETPQSHHMFNAETFRAMKQGSYFCNIARGSLVDEEALRRALVDGPLSAASIDVAEVEPLAPESPLWDLPNLEISPHSSAAMDRMFSNVWDQLYENMRRFLAGEPMKNVRGTRYVPED